MRTQSSSGGLHLTLIGYERRHREAVNWFSEFFDLPHTCRVNVHDQCNELAIKGHVIPSSRLRLIADKNNRVITSLFDSKKRATIDNILRKNYEGTQPFIFELRNINNYQLTRRFACAQHDNHFFHLIDNSDIDWKDPQTLTLICYRAILSEMYIDKYTMFVHNKTKFSTGFEYLGRPVHLRALMSRLKDEFETMLRNQDFDRWQFEVLHFRSDPTIAASAVVFRELTFDELKHLNSSIVLPVTGFSIVLPATGFSMKPVPIVIAIYPESGGQSVVVAFPRWAYQIVQIIIEALGAQDKPTQSALLSRTLLEETEVIMISRRHWDSLGQQHQQLIEKYFEMTTPWNVYATSRSDIDPHLLNLFKLEPSTECCSKH